jgi:DNA processing protein
VLSEFSPGTTPLPAYFPQRNRIISGLCDGILLVEAREKSGSLITAGFGLEQGKDIFALPGRNTDALSRGCNRLIRQGAVLVEGPEDILEEYKISGKYIEQTKAPEKKTKISLETKEEIVYSRLSLEPKHPNDLAKETNLSPNEVMGALLTLELSGRICESGGGFYTVIL